MHRLTENLILTVFLMVALAVAAFTYGPQVTKAVSDHLERAVTPERQREK